MKNISVVGAGAVGIFYGAKLEKAGFKTEMQTRSARRKSEILQMQIRSLWGNFKSKVKLFRSTTDMTPADLVIVSVKSLPIIGYKELLAPLLRKNSSILLLQNGINEEEKLHKIFPDNPVFGGLAFTCINKVSYTKIEHLDYGFIKIGPLKRKDFKLAKTIAEIFSKAEIPVETSADLRYLRWLKLLWNIPFNSLSVICNRATTDKIIRNKNTYELAEELMNEVLLIAKKEGSRIPASEIKAMLERTKKMKPYKTSMLLDFEKGNRMEVDAIFGEPLRIAKKLKVKTPVLETVTGILRFMDENRRKQMN
ncbi:MAG: 2-dehydropantoate 2-reductase [Leptospira sp.]|nr:2-dehydropantoate 2-reductase [Leptospira sp.]